MKKNNKQKLGIHKQTLRNLDPVETVQAEGGFTYSLSLGRRCIKSNAMTSGGTECY